MKKSLLFAAAIVVGLLSGVYAGQNWSTSTGGAWNTPNDTTVVPNQFIVIGSTTGAQPVVKAVDNPAINSLTLAQIKASTPTSTGQLYFCADCVNSPLCISTSTTGSINGASNSIVMASSGTALTVCK